MDIPDPRPSVTGDGVAGWRCGACAYPTVQPVPRCPECGAAVSETTFAATGEVFAATCLHVGVPGRVPPFAVAYVVLDNGPRILVDTPGGTPLRPGERVAVTGTSDRGDPVAVPVGDQP
jgi:uncharacterized protein